MSDIVQLLSSLALSRTAELVNFPAGTNSFAFSPQQSRHQPMPAVVSIPASGADGFDILLWSDTSGIRVCFGGLEQDFDSPDGALRWIRRAMSADCRLRIDFCNKRPYRWILDYLTPNDPDYRQLASGHMVGLLPLQKKWSVYRQNNSHEKQA